MAGAIIYPCGMIPATSPRVFNAIYRPAGSNFKNLLGIGWEASVGADAAWEVTFNPTPDPIPTGIAKFSGWCFANATSGAAKLNIKWASKALGEDPSASALNAEGVATLTWAAGEADKSKELLVTLDADTIVAGEMIIMQIVGETSGWTLAQTLVMVAPRIVFV